MIISSNNIYNAFKTLTLKYNYQDALRISQGTKEQWKRYIARSIILLIVKGAWSVVITKSFVMSIKAEEDLSNNPSELEDKLTNMT